ncbi:hypothetical protein [Undibacterium terreum]|uniref:Uncharacterized protein n=1 Tax=Undibacterium terreum TaxID=1224302 RepID=A0A916UKB2_9BURK|nr:hypothetical protein [Undibacterium terreum]GGC76289.1 hypothetical protein GCM10011396_24440 [Undibacterium terreum]
MSTNSAVSLGGRSGELSFPTPRLPIIRIWGSREVYPEGLFVKAVDDPGGSFTFTVDMPKMPIQFVRDDSGNWTTATIGDFIFNRGGTLKDPVKGWIYIGSNSPANQPGSNPDTPLYTISVYSDGKKLETKFGTYQGIREDPKKFPDGGENYIAEMSDGEGLWLWLYRLFTPVTQG